jgi:transcriptional regulator with XRE-family HTH domain
MSEHAGENLLRLMAAAKLSIHDVAQRSGVDERTIRGITSGPQRPHPRTLHRLAEGLGVAVDEFFVDPAQLLYRRFDRHTNPLVEEVLQTDGHLFEGWREADFDELHSRVGAGGALTRAGTLAAVQEMNRKRELHDKLDVLLESSHAQTIGGIVDLMYGQVVVAPADQTDRDGHPATEGQVAPIGRKMELSPLAP